MKKAEKKVLEKRIAENVIELLAQYDPSPTKKLQKIVEAAAKEISKKVYKITKWSGVKKNKISASAAGKAIPKSNAKKNKK